MLSKTNALPVLPLRQTATLLKTQFKACTSEAFLVSLNQQWVAISQYVYNIVPGPICWQWITV